MQECNEPAEPFTIESVWRSYEGEEEQHMQITMTTDQLCAMARSEERMNVWAPRIASAGAIILAGCFLYNTFHLSQPWIRVGGAWTLGVLCYFAGTLQHRSRRIGTNETCAAFLEREYEEKRRAFLAVRRGLFLFIPGIAASSWGGGPLARAKAMGIDPSSWRFQFVTGPWPFMITILILAAVWLAFGKASKKAVRDQQDVRRSVQI